MKGRGGGATSDFKTHTHRANRNSTHSKVKARHTHPLQTAPHKQASHHIAAVANTPNCTDVDNNVSKGQQVTLLTDGGGALRKGSYPSILQVSHHTPSPHPPSHSMSFRVVSMVTLLCTLVILSCAEEGMPRSACTSPRCRRVGIAWTQTNIDGTKKMISKVWVVSSCGAIEAHVRTCWVGEE